MKSSQARRGLASNGRAGTEGERPGVDWSRTAGMVSIVLEGQARRRLARQGRAVKARSSGARLGQSRLGQVGRFYGKAGAESPGRMRRGLERHGLAQPGEAK